MARSAHEPCLQALDQDLSRVRARSGWMAFARLLIFVLLALGVAETIAVTTITNLAVLSVGVGLWVFLTMRHRIIDEQLWQLQQQQMYHQRGLERLDGNWQHEQADGSAYIEKGHAFAADLDLLGSHGLYALINTCGSEAGRRQLAESMFDDQPQFTIPRSHIQALVPETQRRAEFWAALQLHSRHTGEAEDRALQESLQNFFEQMPSPLSGAGSMCVHALRVLFVTAAIGGFFLIGFPWLFTGFFVVAVIASFVNDRAATGALAVVDYDRARLWYQAQVRAIDAIASWQDIADSDLQQRVQEMTAQRGAVCALRSLWDGLAQQRNPLWRYGIGAILLADWWYRDRMLVTLGTDSQSSERISQQLGVFDALSALSTYAAEQGGAWVEEATDDELVRCTDLQHPLLAANVRIGNDIVLKRNQVLLLTGANASGKSTFLRSLSLAVLMARMNLPVCAQTCAMQPQRLATLMRVHDDVQAGLSRFQAEVKQLRHVLDRSASDGDPVILILDEILAGTNSDERRIGTRAILDHLKSYQGLIIITTHDLELAALADAEPERMYCAHFADQAVLEGEDSDVQFDYRLRPGVLHSTNALRVMKAAGLPIA